MMMALLRQDWTGQDRTVQDQTGQENPAGDVAWTVLDAANDLGDSVTVDACRRVIDANLQGIEPAPSDMAVVVAFFG